MLRLGDGAPSSQAAGGSENVQGVLYRAVLERWRRCHREGGLVVTELRSAEVALSEARKKEGATLLHHLLCSRDAVSMQASFHRWFAACARLDHLHSAQRASSKLRSERAALKEAEVQLALANDAEQALRMQWERERAQWERERAEWSQERARHEQERASWHAQEEHELALVASMTTQQPTPHTDTSAFGRRERPEERREELPQRTVAESRSLPSHRLLPHNNALTARPSDDERLRAPTTRSFGVRAEELVAAWRRESSAVH